MVIPALNEEATVAAVVRGAHDHAACDVLVIDDGSTDGTRAEALAAGAYVLSHPFNLGVGVALRSGFRYAAEQGYTTVVQLDGDGQHDPAEISKLVSRLDDADLVIGSRFAGGYDVGRLRRVAMRLLSRIVSRRLGVRITDTTSGFRAFGRPAVEQFCTSYPGAYLSDTVEALLIAADEGLRVVEEPVNMRTRQGGRATGRVRSAFHLLRISLVISLHGVRRPSR